jgi:pyruvate dehydrogenase E2 component (dihydrolipoamide acetyltransferase)
MSNQRLLVMPKLGLTMTEGVVSQWKVTPGQRFAAGEVIIVVESEKTAFEVEAPAAGIFEQVLVKETETVPVGTLLAHWRLDGDEEVSRPNVQQERLSETAVPAQELAPSSLNITRQPSAVAEQQQGQRTLATPLARRMAREAKIDLTAIAGSGSGGRIQAADVEAAVNASAHEPQAQSPDERKAIVAPAAAIDYPPGRLSPPTGIERTMAARVTAAKREIPHFYLAMDFDIGPLTAMRDELNCCADKPRVSMTHLLIAAIVHGLQAVPRMNAVWTDAGILTYQTIDVGIAVHTERGLMSPVVRDLGNERFYGLMTKFDDVVARARQGDLRADDQNGAAMTISNAGMHNVHYMTSIIVPGQSAILGVGSVQDCFRPDAAGAPVLRRELGVVLSADHRVHTGVGALAFLKAFEHALLNPLHLLMGN